MKLSESDIESRRPVWVAFSDLFLDTDVSLRYENIITVCAESNYSTNELEDILRHEVAPLVSGNLWSVAGEWSGFDPDELAQEISGNCERPASFWQLTKIKFKNRWFKRYIDEHWERILPKIDEARSNPAYQMNADD